MKSLQSQHPSFAGLISVILIYIFLIVLILVFSNQILYDIATGRSLSRLIIIPIAVGLPAFLIAVLVYNILKLLRDRKAGNPGTRFKIKLILFFSFIAFLSSIPQGILSISFISTTTRAWFGSEYADSLRGGLHLALEYYNDKLTDLELLGESPLVTTILRGAERRPENTWEMLSGINSSIHSLQIFDENGKEVMFRGDELARIDSPFKQNTLEEGLLPKETTRERSILRTVKKYTSGTQVYIAVLSTVLPENFDREAESITNTLEMFTQIGRYQVIFLIVLIAFYAFFSFPILLLAIIVSFNLSDEIIRPIVNLEEATKRVSEGDFSIRILSRTKDELSILIGSFNRMVAELEKSRRQLIQNEKVIAWQEIAQRMAHEIKNPLTPIKLSAQRILRKYEAGGEDFDAVLRPAVSSIVEEVEKLNSLLIEFRDFARLPAPAPERMKVKETVETAASVFAASYPEAVIHTDDIQEDTVIIVDRDQINRVFTNLFTNAIEAMSGKGDIFVRADLVTKGDLDYCRIQVHDTGDGIEKEFLEKVFHPYFTTKEKGTGLGLAIVERIVYDHKGQIWFETQKGVGTTFFIDLPGAQS